MIAYLKLTASSRIDDRTDLFRSLQGLESWELDSPNSAYLLLEPWMGVRGTRQLYQALRGIFGPRIRFGAADQKTTARAAALYRAVPHCAIITPEVAEQFLTQLPIDLLPGLGHRTTRFLERQGVTTFDAFRRLSGETLKEWFGVSGLILQQFSRGLDPRIVESRRTFASSSAT